MVRAVRIFEDGQCFEIELLQEAGAGPHGCSISVPDVQWHRIKVYAVLEFSGS